MRKRGGRMIVNPVRYTQKAGAAKTVNVTMSRAIRAYRLNENGEFVRESSTHDFTTIAGSLFVTYPAPANMKGATYLGILTGSYAICQADA